MAATRFYAAEAVGALLFGSVPARDITQSVAVSKRPRPNGDQIEKHSPSLDGQRGRDCRSIWLFGGAGDGIRTHDILLGKQTLCQLSYARVFALSAEVVPR